MKEVVVVQNEGQQQVEFVLSNIISRNTGGQNSIKSSPSGSPHGDHQIGSDSSTGGGSSSTSRQPIFAKTADSLAKLSPSRFSDPDGGAPLRQEASFVGRYPGIIQKAVKLAVTTI